MKSEDRDVLMLVAAEHAALSMILTAMQLREIVRSPDPHKAFGEFKRDMLGLIKASHDDGSRKMVKATALVRQYIDEFFAKIENAVDVEVSGRGSLAEPE